VVDYGPSGCALQQPKKIENFDSHQHYRCMKPSDILVLLAPAGLAVIYVLTRCLEWRSYRREIGRFDNAALRDEDWDRDFYEFIERRESSSNALRTIRSIDFNQQD
jgi:hypothetical protein